MKKKIICIAIVTMLLSLSACGSANTSKTSDTASAKSSDSATTDEVKELNFLAQSSPLAAKDPNEKLIWKRYEEKTGIHINWTNYSWDVFAEKRNLKLASNDLPDAIFDAAMNDYDILNYAKKGVIVPVEQLLDTNMPNLKAIYDKYPAYKAFVTTPDEHIYSFPWIEELGAGKDSIHSISNIPWINTTWLKNLGLEMPKTTEELKTVLQAFKDNDPNQNGDKTDEIPMSFIFGTGGEAPTSLYGAFGLGDNDDHLVITNDGKVEYTLNNDGYKAAIKWMNEMQNAGLFDKEVFTQDWSTYSAKGKDQKYGLFFTWDMGNVSGFVSGDYSDPSKIVSDYAPLPALSGPDGNKNITRTNGFGLDRGRMVITADNKNLEATTRWIDGLYDPLQSAQDNWGTYGDTTGPNIFELDGTMLKHLPLGDVSPWELRQKTFVGGPLAVLDEYYGKYITVPDDAAWRMNIVSTVYAPDMKADNNFPRVFYSIEDQTELTNIEVPLNEYVKSMQAEFMKDGKIDERWDEYTKKLNDLKLPRYLELKQQYYDNFIK